MKTEPSSRRAPRFLGSHMANTMQEKKVVAANTSNMQAGIEPSTALLGNEAKYSAVTIDLEKRVIPITITRSTTINNKKKKKGLICWCWNYV